MVDRYDVALKSLDQTRAEIVERVKLRDTALLAHVTVVSALAGAYFGFAAKDVSAATTPFIVSLSLLFPLLSLVFAQIVAQHTFSIDMMATFIRERLEPVLKPIEAPLWDSYPNENRGLLQQSKYYSTLMKHMLVLHSPTIVLTTCAALAVHAKVPALGDIGIQNFLSWVFAPHAPAVSWFIGGYAGATVIYLVACAVTVSGFSQRRRTLDQAAQSKIEFEPSPSELRATGK